MSIEKVILAHFQAYIKGEQAIKIINHATFKGCILGFSYDSVGSEPYYTFPTYQNFQIKTVAIMF